jgi:hypothetical protein
MSDQIKQKPEQKELTKWERLTVRKYLLTRISALESRFKKDYTHLSIIIGTFYIRSMINGTINAIQLLNKIKKSIKEGHRDRTFIDRQIEYFKNHDKLLKANEGNNERIAEITGERA